MNDTLILAPMQGLTDSIYRNTHHKHFHAFDEMIAPYILAHGHKPTRTTVLEKIYQDYDPKLKLIPQLLGNDVDGFIIYANQLFKIGYNIINWNLGCPYLFVTRKQRGSGLLPYPEKIKQILDNIIPKISNKLSIKIRLGLTNNQEIYPILELLNDYPLYEIIIHPRTADQFYDGNIYLDEFHKYLEITKHQVVYNGNIFSMDNLKEYKAQFPTINRWMIGRGVLRNPVLPSLLKNTAPKSKNERLQLLMNFYYNLYEQYYNNTEKKEKLLHRIKELWANMSLSFESPADFFQEIKTVKKLEDLNKTVDMQINKYSWLE